MRYLGPVHFRYAPGSTVSSDLEGLARTFLGQLQGVYPRSPTKGMFRAGPGWAMKVMFVNGRPVVDIRTTEETPVVEDITRLYNGQYFFVEPRYTLDSGSTSDVFTLSGGRYPECMLRYDAEKNRVISFSSTGAHADYAYNDRFYPVVTVARMSNGEVDWQGSNGHIITWKGAACRYFRQLARSSTVYIGGVAFTPNGPSGLVCGVAVISGSIANGGYDILILASTGVGGFIQLLRATASIATKKYTSVVIADDIPGNYAYNAFFNSNATAFTHTVLTFSVTFNPPTSTLNMWTTATSATTYGSLGVSATGELTVAATREVHTIDRVRATEEGVGVMESILGVPIASDYAGMAIKYLTYNYTKIKESYTPASFAPPEITLTVSGWSGHASATWAGTANPDMASIKERVWVSMGGRDIEVISNDISQIWQRSVTWDEVIDRTVEACVGNNGVVGQNSTDTISSGHTLTQTDVLILSVDTYWIVDLDLRVGYISTIHIGDRVTRTEDRSGSISYGVTSGSTTYGCAVSPPPDISITIPPPDMYLFLSGDYNPISDTSFTTTGERRWAPTLTMRLVDSVETTSFTIDTHDDGFPSTSSPATYRLANVGADLIHTHKLLGDINSAPCLDLRFMLDEGPNSPGIMKNVISLYYSDLAFEDPNSTQLSNFRGDVSSFRNTLGTWDRHTFFVKAAFLIYPQVDYLVTFVGSDGKIHSVLNGEDVTTAFTEEGVAVSYTPISVVSFK